MHITFGINGSDILIRGGVINRVARQHMSCELDIVGSIILSCGVEVDDGL